MFERVRLYLNPGEMKLTEDFCQKENGKSLVFLFIVTFLLTGINVLTHLLFKRSISLEPSTIIMVAALFCFIPIASVYKDESFNNVIAIYFISMGIMAGVIFGDLAFSHDGNGYFAYFYMFLMPQLIMDVPWRMIIFSLSVCTAYSCLASAFMAGLDLQAHLTIAWTCTIVSLILGIRRVHGILDLLHLNTNIQDVAEHDPLTLVFNRAGGEMLIRDHIANQISGSLAIMDIDNFKNVNDDFGHQEGDRVLWEVGAMLLRHFRSTDVVMRLGGDEFVVYVVGMVDEHFVRIKMEEIVSSMRTIMLEEKSGKHISISLGCVINDGSYPDMSSLYRKADQMLYKAKEAGKDGFCLLNVSYKAEARNSETEDLAE